MAGRPERYGVHEVERRFGKVLSVVILVGVLTGIAYGGHLFHDRQYERVEVPYHTIRFDSLGLHRQGEVVRVRAVVDEGSVKVLEGRAVTLQLVDSDNKAGLEAGGGYVPLDSVEIDTEETDVGYVEARAHRTDTYYVVYRNEDWWNATLKVADGAALDQQLLVKVLSGALLVASVMVFGWAYARLFEVPLRERLGLVRRPRGPGSRSAYEPKGPA